MGDHFRQPPSRHRTASQRNPSGHTHRHWALHSNLPRHRRRRNGRKIADPGEFRHPDLHRVPRHRGCGHSLSADPADERRSGPRHLVVRSRHHPARRPHAGLRRPHFRDSLRRRGVSRESHRHRRLGTFRLLVLSTSGHQHTRRSDPHRHLRHRHRLLVQGGSRERRLAVSRRRPTRMEGKRFLDGGSHRPPDSENQPRRGADPPLVLRLPPERQHHRQHHPRRILQPRHSHHRP